MAWEKRSGRQYLYKSYRDGSGRVCHKYLGRGPRAASEALKQRKVQEKDNQAKLKVSKLQSAYLAL